MWSENYSPCYEKNNNYSRSFLLALGFTREHTPRDNTRCVVLARLFHFLVLRVDTMASGMFDLGWLPDPGSVAVDSYQH